MKKIISLCGAVVLLSGCETVIKLPENIHNPIHNRTGEYRQEHSVASLQMPAGVAEVRPDPTFVIPDIPNPNGPEVTILPPGSEALKLATQQQKKHKG